METKPVVLHFTGSVGKERKLKQSKKKRNSEKKISIFIVSDNRFLFKLNLFYASAFDTEKNNQFNHVWCLVRPEHPRYTFASDIKIILIKDGSDLRNDIILNWFDLPSMLQLLSVIKPTFVLPHVFCCEGSTKLRYQKKI